jgi:hypothetical protein
MPQDTLGHALDKRGMVNSIVKVVPGPRAHQEASDDFPTRPQLEGRQWFIIPTANLLAAQEVEKN